MTEVIHGLISGLIWSAILGSCLIAIAAVITAAVPARAKVGVPGEFRGQHIWGSSGDNMLNFSD